MKFITLSTSLSTGQKFFIGAVIFPIALGLTIQHIKESKTVLLSTYLPEEKEAITHYIEQQYGKPDTIHHIFNNSQIQLDIAIIRPTEDIPYFKLVSIGAGTYKMEIPEELNFSVNDRAEYVIYLPMDWNSNSDTNLDSWVNKTLGLATIFPPLANDWTGVGHTMLYNEDWSPVSDTIKFNSYILLESKGKDGQIVEPVRLGNSDKTVAFHQVFPLYPEELNYTMEHSTQELLDLFGPDMDYAIDINRKNYCGNKTDY